MSRKKYCIGECDFSRYYTQQAGRGYSDITIYRGHPYQRGYGFASVFKRFGIPLVKFLGNHLLNAGLAIGSDIVQNKPINASTLKRKFSETAKAAAKDGLARISDKIDQIGNGRKVYKKRRKRLHKDIFS